MAGDGREREAAHRDPGAQLESRTANSTGRASVHINAPLQGLPASGNDLPTSSDVSKARYTAEPTSPTNLKQTHASKHPQAEENETARAISSSEPPLKKVAPQVKTSTHTRSRNFPYRVLQKSHTTPATTVLAYAETKTNTATKLCELGGDCNDRPGDR